MPGIAIFRTGGIGDVILSTVGINIIQELAPDAELHWFGREPTLSLIRVGFPGVVTHEFKPGASYRQNIDVVRKAAGHFDLIIDLQRSARTMIIGIICAQYLGCGYTTWNKFSVRRSVLVMQSLLTKRRAITKQFALPRRHEVMAKCIVNALQSRHTIKCAEKPLNFWPFIPAYAQHKKKNAIAINLGALYASKELPIDKWAIIVGHIVAQQSCSELYFLGDARKYADAELLINQRQMGNIQALNCCGRTTLAEAAQILAGCKCTLTNDSALSHLSESVGTPVIVFFGPTHEQFGYRPFLPESKSISMALSCRPCTKGGKTACRFGDFKCLRELELSPALSHLDHLATQPV